MTITFYKNNLVTDKPNKVIASVAGRAFLSDTKKVGMVKSGMPFKRAFLVFLAEHYGAMGEDGVTFNDVDRFCDQAYLSIKDILWDENRFKDILKQLVDELDDRAETFRILSTYGKFSEEERQLFSDVASEFDTFAARVDGATDEKKFKKYSSFELAFAQL